jgi:hypothetical protein
VYPSPALVVVLSVPFPFALLLTSCLAAPEAIETFVQPGLHDAEFTAKIVSGDQAALAKIGKDFGTSYKFSSAHVYVKDPFELRIESVYEGTKVTMIENGTTVSYRAAGFRRPRDLTHSPGGRQTFLDFGILTSSLFSVLFDAAFVSADNTAGTATFDLTFKPSPDYQDTSRHRIVVDTAKHYVIRREWFGQDGKLRATFDYSEPQQCSGCWVPTDMKVTNAEGKLAGETRAENVKINSDLDEKLFNAH